MPFPNSSRAQYTELYVATHDTIINAGNPEMPLFNGDALLGRALNNSMKVEKQGGPVVRANIIYKDSDRGKWVRGLETLDLGEDDCETTVSVEWAKYVDPVTVSNDTIEENAGDGRIDDLVKSKMARSMASIRNKVSQALYASTQVPKLPLSLITICATGNTIGGIAQTTTDFQWAANIDGVAAQLADNDLYDMYLRCTFDNVSPDLMPCGRDLYRRIWKIMADKVQINNLTSAGNLGMGANKGIPFDEGVFFMDKNCPNGNIFYLSSEKLKLVVHRDVFFSKEGPFEQGDVLGVTFRHAIKLCLIPTSIRNLGRLFNKSA